MSDHVLACQHLNLETNLCECKDQGWFKVQTVPMFILIDVRCFDTPQVEDHSCNLNNSSQILLMVLCFDLMYIFLLLQEIVLDR
jgi:hypothetical protein